MDENSHTMIRDGYPGVFWSRDAQTDLSNGIENYEISVPCSVSAPNRL